MIDSISTPEGIVHVDSEGNAVDAMGDTIEGKRYVLTTTKGARAADTLAEICAWQLEHQGAMPTLEVDGESIDVDAATDAETVEKMVEAVEAAIADECEEYTIADDSGISEVTALNADAAAREYARREDIDGVETAEDLRAYVARKGGYGHMEDEAGIWLWSVAQ